MKETNPSSIHYKMQSGILPRKYKLQWCDIGIEISDLWGFGAVQRGDVGRLVTLDQHGAIWMTYKVSADSVKIGRTIKGSGHARR